MHRIFIAGFSHETNTFWPEITGFDAFFKYDYVRKEKLLGKFAGTRTPIGGFLDVLERAGAEVIPSLAAKATPSGTVSAELAKTVTDTVLQDLKEAGQVDGILIQLHGAMVTEDSDDGEGDFLKAVRKAAGPDIPIIATLDLHANISQAMMDSATALFPYHEYPHADMFERGRDAAEAMLQILEGRLRPVMRRRQLPAIVMNVPTENEEFAEIREKLASCYGDPDVVQACLVHGFYMTDTPDSTAQVLVITNNREDLAERLCDELADFIWERRSVLTGMKTCTPEEAFREAEKTPGLVVLADICDNPGAGSPGDATLLLRELLKAGIQKAAVASFCDPETVELCHKAGVGAEVELVLGSKKKPEMTGEPIRCRAYVKTLSDGVYRNRGPMNGGALMNLHRSAVIVVNGIHIVVGSAPLQASDPMMFESHGLMLHDFHILVVKSAIHYQAAYKPLAEKLISVSCPAFMPGRLSDLTYHKMRRPVYPLDNVEDRHIWKT